MNIVHAYCYSNYIAARHMDLGIDDKCIKWVKASDNYDEKSEYKMEGLNMFLFFRNALLT